MRPISNRGRLVLVGATFIGALAFALRKPQTPSYVPAEGTPDRLKAYASCRPDDGIKTIALDRLPGSGVRHRSVTTATGERSVSMVDGYRAILAYSGESPFVNIKVEVSAPAEYASDKEAIVAQLEHLGKAPPLKKRFHGFDLDAVDRATIDASGPLGIYVLFKDDKRTVITLYFLNQHPAARHFQSLAEYQALRDRFLEGYVACLNRD